MNPLKIIVKPVPRESVQRRHLTPVKVFDPTTQTFVDTGHVSGKTKAKNSPTPIPASVPIMGPSALYPIQRT